MTRMRGLILLLILGLAVAARAEEKEALALAESGIALLEAGKMEKGKDMLFKAPAHDQNCPVALLELGKQFEAEGMTASAADFLARAVVEFAKGEKANPAYSGKRMDANRRLQKLNPYASQFTTMLEDYAAELGRVVKKSPDSVTAEEAVRRMDALNLGAQIAADKMPKIERPKTAVKSNDEGPRRMVRTENGWEPAKPREAKTEVAPDVERALKAAGWGTITGVWKKLEGVNKYEVTDGKLESPKLNGAIQVFVHKGSTGKVKAFVRATKRDDMWDDDDRWSAGGYGVILKGLNAKIFVPTGWSGSSYSPYLDHEVSLPDASVKHLILVQIMEKKLEITVNNKRESLRNDPIAKDGVFMIQFEGTVVIDSPQAGGQ